jgi:hypothetical protein
MRANDVDMIKRISRIVAAGCIATVATVAVASAQRRPPQAPATPPPPPQVKAYVVMTPTGPATCATWVQWRAPGANPADKEAIQYWAEGYISGLASGTHHDVLGGFQLQDLGAWLDRYCAANPRADMPVALHALGRDMMAHPGGKL